MAFSIGVSVEEFKHLTPRKLEYCLKGYNMNRQMRDREMWLWFGNYGLSAVSVAAEHCLAGKKAKSKFIDKPIFSRLTQNTGLTQEELYEKEVKRTLLTEERWMANGKRKGLPETVI